MPGENQQVKVRVAPSPTGEPHVGTAYMGLFNLAFARTHSGSLILRIEDTDRERSTLESERSIIECMKWLGIDFDEGPGQGGPSGPYRQSERFALYKEHAEILLERGTAYRCFCTKERLDALREQQRKAGGDTRYDGHCRDLDPAEVEKRLAAGEAYVVRLKMPVEGETTVPDLLRGDVTYRNSLVDDQVLLKSDGFPTYHLANVVDDHLMGVTHVIRAEEWINSTPKHIVLYEAFGWKPPVWIHMPLLRNPDRGKSKISKRKNPVSLRYYIRRGFLPEALLNFLALMGWSFPGEEREIFSLDEFIANFDIRRVHLGGPVFDMNKLEWLNGQYIRNLDEDDFVKRVIKHYAGDLPIDEDAAASAAPLVKDRMVVLGDFDYQTEFLHGTPLLHSLLPLLEESPGIADMRSMLQKLRDHFDRSTRYWNRAELDKALGGLDDGLVGLCRVIFRASSNEELADTLWTRGKSLAVKIIQEAGGTLKKLVPKKRTPAELSALLNDLAQGIERLPDWNAAGIEEYLKTQAQEREWKTGDLFMPVRIACTGRSATPPLFETMVLVGRERCVERMRAIAGFFAA